MNLDFIVIVIIGIFILGIFILIFSKKKKFSLENFRIFSQKIENTRRLDPAHCILESHKIFVAALRTVVTQKDLTSAKVVAKFSKSFPNEPRIWKFHGLRNRIAHETDINVNQHLAEEARREFIRALKSIAK